ncbi:AtpZ/AtpI family protein [Chloroflexota bacterium]
MSRWVSALRLIGVGWYIGCCIVLGTLGGLWLDNKFNTGPIVAIVGLIVGILVAFYGTYRMILPNINKKQTGGKG